MNEVKCNLCGAGIMEASERGAYLKRVSPKGDGQPMIMECAPQRILTCAVCGVTPPDGEDMWKICGEYWCEKCCNETANGQRNNNANPITAYWRYGAN